jgi:hypothetical protein
MSDEPRVRRILQAAVAGFAGDFRGLFRLLAIEIWPSKTQAAFWLGLCPSVQRKSE